MFDSFKNGVISSVKLVVAVVLTGLILSYAISLLYTSTEAPVSKPLYEKEEYTLLKDTSSDLGENFGKLREMVARKGFGNKDMSVSGMVQNLSAREVESYPEVEEYLKNSYRVALLYTYNRSLRELGGGIMKHLIPLSDSIANYGLISAGLENINPVKMCKNLSIPPETCLDRVKTVLKEETEIQGRRICKGADFGLKADETGVTAVDYFQSLSTYNINQTESIRNSCNFLEKETVFIPGQIVRTAHWMYLSAEYTKDSYKMIYAMENTGKRIKQLLEEKS